MNYYIPFLPDCNPKKWTQLEKNEAFECLQSFLADSTYNRTFKHNVLITDEETAINIAEIIYLKSIVKRCIRKWAPGENNERQADSKHIE